MKQETLEEETLSRIKFVLLANNNAQAIRILEQYSEFQKERMYSEEEVLKILNEFCDNFYENSIREDIIIKWFQQFKKK